MSNNQIPWTEKYRPEGIEGIVSHDSIKISLLKFIEKKTLPHLLFFGQSGVGKTSTFMCCVKELYGPYAPCMTLRLNASNERGIDTVRTKIKNFVCNNNSIFIPEDQRNIFKLVILDEIDSMTVEAQGMLRQTIEKNSATTRFCLVCNDINKVNIALQSRCTMFHFPPIKNKWIRFQIELIANSEQITYTKRAIDAIVEIANGDMRAAINVIQHAYLTDIKITENIVYKITGYCNPCTTDLIFDYLIDECTSLNDDVDNVYTLVSDNNITIPNLLKVLIDKVLYSDKCTKWKIFIVSNFANIEMYSSLGVEQKMLVIQLCGLFHKKIDS
jgi:DNA polymerase III gamma/tau subunit